MVGEPLPGSPEALGAQTRIDQEIAELTILLRDRINSLRTQRNTLSLISRLPPELLSLIFIYCARIHHETTTLPIEGVPKWVNVSYVCRHWRNVALNCPILWTHVFTASRNWTEELLSRSKTGPLRVRLGRIWRGSRKLHVLQQVLAHTEHIQELEMELPSVHIQSIFPAFSSPAPLLQSLKIRVTDMIGLPDETYIFNLFNGVTPALRQIELVNCFMSLPISVLDSLTTLILRDLRDPISPTIAELQVTLCSIPRLEHLELCRTLSLPRSELDSHSAISSQTPQLPHLSRLFINERLSTLVKLLSCIDVPSQTEVRICAYKVVPEELVLLHSLLVAKFFASRALNIRTLAVDVDFTTSLFFSMSEDNHHDPWSPHWGCNIPLMLWFPDHNQRDIIRDIIRDADSSGFLAGLRRAHVKLGPYDELDNCSTFFEDCFSPLPRLRYIQLSHATTSLGCFFQLLSLTPHRRAEQGEQNAVLGQSSHAIPALTLDEIVIHSSRFDDEVAQFGQHAARVSDLYEALASCKAKWLPVDRLILTKCRNVFKEDVAKLKDVVTEVVWDGIEQEDPVPIVGETTGYVDEGISSDASSVHDEESEESADEAEAEELSESGEENGESVVGAEHEDSSMDEEENGEDDDSLEEADVNGESANQSEQEGLSVDDEENGVGDDLSEEDDDVDADVLDPDESERGSEDPPSEDQEVGDSADEGEEDASGLSDDNGDDSRYSVGESDGMNSPVDEHDEVIGDSADEDQGGDWGEDWGEDNDGYADSDHSGGW